VRKDRAKKPKRCVGAPRFVTSEARPAALVYSIEESHRRDRNGSARDGYRTYARRLCDADSLPYCISHRSIVRKLRCVPRRGGREGSTEVTDNPLPKDKISILLAEYSTLRAEVRAPTKKSASPRLWKTTGVEPSAARVVSPFNRRAVI
jgi:hypothetical protein